MEKVKEEQLLELAKGLLTSTEGNNIKEKIDNYLKNTNDDKCEIFEALSYIVFEDQIVSFSFKDIICKILINMLNKNEYKNGDLLNEITSSNNSKLRKIINIAKLMAYINLTSEYKILFLMLNEQKFEDLKKILKKYDITIYESFKDFNDKIDNINEKNITELIKKEQLRKKDITSLLADIDDVCKFIEVPQKQQEATSNKKSKKSKKSKKKNTNNDVNKIISNPKDTNQIIKENENKLYEERKKRIFALMGDKIDINDDKEINYENFINNDDREGISEKDLLIDVYEIKDKKTHLFSPISLIVNNFKHEFEKNDFEIFNKDNNYVEVFGKYLEKIIGKLNNYINNGEDENYIIENDIKIGRYNTHFYLCCKFNELFKNKYYINEKTKNENKNCLISNFDNEIEILKIKKNIKEEGNVEEEEKFDTNENESSLQFKENSKGDTINKNLMSHNYENDVKEFICESNDCKLLHNVIFFYNLKIPKKINDTIIMKSVILTFNNKCVGTLYGFREIDICLKCKSSIEKSNSILSNNLIYEINNGKFKKKNELPIDVSLKENSIIFCEVKNSFCKYITKGDEKFDIINLNQKKDYNINNIDNNNLTYIDQLNNLQKKSKIFLDFFLKQNIINKNDLFHILYLYDESNISNWKEGREVIENKINIFFENLKIPKEFNNIKKVIFQIAYFNKEIYRAYRNTMKDEKIKELEEKAKQKNDIIKKLEEETKEDADIIKKLEEETKEDADIIKKLEERKKEYVDTIKKLEERKKEDADIIKKLEEETKEDADIIKKLEERKKEDDNTIKKLEERKKEDDNTIKKLEERKKEDANTIKKLKEELEKIKKNFNK